MICGAIRDKFALHPIPSRQIYLLLTLPLPKIAYFTITSYILSKVQLNFNGSNDYGTMKISSRQG